jgi:cephalosporin-C deacetylase-like acetyl esterase
MAVLRSLFFLLGVSVLLRAEDAVKITAKPDHANGIYALNEPVIWQIDVTGDRTGLTALPYTVKKDGQDKVAEGTLDLSAGPATITATRGEPGALMLQIYAADRVKTPLPLAFGGAIFEPYKIGFSAPAPADFDDFWQGKLKELNAVPINPVVTKGDISAVKNSEGVDYYKVTLDNIRGTHVQGQLARPTVGDKFPAMLMFQFAGVYPLDKAQVVAQAKPGWLVLNISAHDLPIDESDDYYKNLKEGALKNYVYIGSEDRESSYFLRMLLGTVRAEQYLASRPDWDGKIMVATGTSQGGLQSFACAGLCSQVSEVMVLVPAGCDVYGPLANPPRAFCWPYWLSNWGPQGRDMKKVQATAGYFDAAYFASRIKCPTLVGVGLLDEAARSAGVLAAYNSIQAPKEILILPDSNHYGTGGAQLPYLNAFNAWKTALQKGQPPPIPVAASPTAPTPPSP